ncbi:reverse transcriptase [Phytophthora megakarya]|uniref:Reverse transcriptase n=1 Tax=Phytophthora megakarya TaxID=4795 RepID=A0A225VGZ5_9STRA|nr:reverse transcriptase [Phytophthora megakarya]
MVNSLTRLMVYPMPLISDLLEDLDKALWYCSLDMASGFWVVPMTDRAREISAFITPFGLFEWSRMPFGLTNAPQIYQRLVDNALYGFLKISRSGDAGATTDVLQTGIADDPDRESVLGRRSYIDDIMIAAESWDQMCRRVENLLEACDKWNLTISVAKRFWGMDKVGYLGHGVSIGGLGASLKDLKSLTDLPFPGSLRSMQSFLGIGELEKRSDLREILDRNDPIPRDHDPTELKLTGSVDESDWAISAWLTQEHDGIYHPVAFASRTLKTNELNYNVTEKEVLALLRILDLYYNLLVGREIRVLTRHSTLAWLFKSTGLQGRLGQWSALLAPWTLEITKCTKGYLESLIVNEAEYNGLILGLDMLEGLDRRRLVVCGDSNLVIRQVRGEIDCKAPGLTLLKKRKALDRLRKWDDHELVHVKRDWNGSADSLASAALQRQGGIEVQEKHGYQDLVTLNRSLAGVMDEDRIREIRVGRIKQAQEDWITGMKKYLSGSIADLTQAEARSYGKIAADYEIGLTDVGSHQIDAGSRIWLYLDRVKEGYARKLAHLWPFRVAEKINEFSVKLEIAGTGYQIFPVEHNEADRLDFDEILLQEDIWVPDLGAVEYEVERISDVRSGKKTRFGRIYREFLVHWAGYDEPTWVDEAELNCGAMLNAFLRERVNRNRFNVMQSHEEM